MQWIMFLGPVHFFPVPSIRSLTRDQVERAKPESTPVPQGFKRVYYLLMQNLMIPDTEPITSGWLQKRPCYRRANKLRRSSSYTVEADYGGG